MIYMMCESIDLISVIFSLYTQHHIYIFCISCHVTFPGELRATPKIKNGVNYSALNKFSHPSHFPRNCNGLVTNLHSSAHDTEVAAHHYYITFHYIKLFPNSLK